MHCKFICAVFLFFISLSVSAQRHAAPQKAIAAVYSGGHGCIDKTLTLYTDSTFKYEQSSGLLFIRSKQKGLYSFQGDQLVMFTRKKLAFLHCKEANKYYGDSFHVRGDHILMYSEEDERSKDANMIRDYNTMFRLRS